MKNTKENESICNRFAVTNFYKPFDKMLTSSHGLDMKTKPFRIERAIAKARHLYAEEAISWEQFRKHVSQILFFSWGNQVKDC